ncbi:hypothetical protein [Xanthomonas hortorum]|uniref:Uncharacterized protein n=1 Tax=Xanthomonas hortorum TaxID=56454 RepID=A0AA47EQZ4_9XANT|nr:hypothetical protein [Xanthomonas hortorum]WAH63715.1 hypothetical protein OEG85_20115 [Xanthomonas hortorum]
MELHGIDAHQATSLASSDSSIHKARRRSCDLRLKVRANQVLFWIAAIYEPGQTVIHQGAYFSFVGSMLFVLLVLARYFPPVLYAVAVLNSGIAAFTYAFDVSHHGASLVIYTVATLVLAVGLVVACGLASGDTSEDRSK